MSASWEAPRGGLPLADHQGLPLANQQGKRSPPPHLACAASDWRAATTCAGCSDWAADRSRNACRSVPIFAAAPALPDASRSGCLYMGLRPPTTAMQIARCTTHAIYEVMYFFARSRLIVDSLAIFFRASRALPTSSFSSGSASGCSISTLARSAHRSSVPFNFLNIA